MLLPRFSIRTMLLATAVCGGFFLVLAAAARGDNRWAIAITIGVGGVLLTFLVYALFLAAALVISACNPLRPREAAIRSPFAQHVPAPQLVPQDDEE